MVSSTPKHTKTLAKSAVKPYNEDQILLKKELSICFGKDGIKKQAAHFLQLFERGERKSILKLPNILPFEVDAKTVVAMKADLG